MENRYFCTGNIGTEAGSGKFRNMEEIIRLDNVDTYNRLFGLETQHPLVSVIDLAKATKFPKHFTMNYGVYALYLKQVKCGDLRYGRQTYDYQEGTVTSFAPGQVVEVTMDENVRPLARGVIFHPDLIRGTSLGREIRHYSFFSYSSNEALHLSDDEKMIFNDCLDKISMELAHPIDKHSKLLISKNIELLLDYCMRFYERQFITRSAVNKSVVIKFDELLDDYFHSGKTQSEGLPTVKYFADRICLSPNYFGDLIKKETGRTAQEYIQGRIMDAAKDMIIGTDKSVSEIAYSLGFQYPQHFSRVFKKHTGNTPNEYRHAGYKDSASM